MQKSLLEGKVYAIRPRGRPGKSWMNNIMERTKLNYEKCIRGAEDRDYWRGVTTNLPKLSNHRRIKSKSKDCFIPYVHWNLYSLLL